MDYLGTIIIIVCVIVVLAFLPPLLRDFAFWLVNHRQTLESLRNIESRLESISEKIDTLTGESENGNTPEDQ